MHNAIRGAVWVMVRYNFREAMGQSWCDTLPFHQSGTRIGSSLRLSHIFVANTDCNGVRHMAMSPGVKVMRTLYLMRVFSYDEWKPIVMTMRKRNLWSRSSGSGQMMYLSEGRRSKTLWNDQQDCPE